MSLEKEISAKPESSPALLSANMSANVPAIVVDTNVLISAALLPQSNVSRVLDLAVQNFVIAQNRATWEELTSRIEKPKFDRYFEVGQRLVYLTRLAQLVKMHNSVAKVEVSRDADDDKFIALAIDSSAKIIISGDEDLKRIGSYEGVQVLSPAEFLAKFAPDGQPE